MKKIFSLFLLFFFFSINSYSQYVHKIKADSVLITNDSCTAELNLENSTKDVKGFLYNKGNGRTEFKKPLVKLNDSLYLIGADTLKLNQSSNNGNYVQNQFVAKQTASAWIDTFKASRITINNDSSKTIFATTGRGQMLFNDNVPLKGMSVFPYNGLDDRWGVFEFKSYKRNSIDSVNFRPLITTIKDYSGPVGPTVWGNNYISNLRGATRTIESSSSFRLDTGFYYIGGNWDHPSAPILLDWSLGANQQQAGRLTIQRQPTWNDIYKMMPNVMTRNFYNNGSIVANYNGWHGGYLSTYQFQGGSGSSMDRFFHYGIGTLSYGNGVTIKEMMGYYLPSMYVSGKTNRTWSIYSEGVNDNSYLAGKLLIGDTSHLNADVHKLYISGSSKFSGNIVQPSGRTLLGGAVDDGTTALQVKGFGEGYKIARWINATNIQVGSIDNGGNLTISGILNLPASTPPTSSADASGTEGDLKRDANGNLYLKANGQWLKFSGVTF